MKIFKKAVLLALVLALMVSLCGCVFGGGKRIGKDAALQAALEDAGLTSDDVKDVDIELERTLTSAWYEVDFDSGRDEYEYKIHAYTGEILASARD